MTEPTAEPSPPGLVVVIDALDSALLAEFWSSALRYEQQGSVAQFRVLVPPSGGGRRS